MASTYALPVTPRSHTHSHGRSSSQYTPESSSYTASPINGASPVRKHGHRHNRSEANTNGQLYGAVRSQYAEYNGHAHSHAHDHAHEHKHAHARSTSNDSTYTLKPFLNPAMGRSTGRPRGESDLGRPPSKTPLTTYGFSSVSPIHETPPYAPLPSTPS